MTESQPPSVAAVGAIVRSYRKASGLSQKDLAHLGGVSRATLNYLESGREDMEIGASRLFAITAALAIPFGLPGGVDRAGDDEALEAVLRRTGSGRKRLALPVLMEALASARVPDDGSESLAAFFAGAETAEAVLAVRSAAVRSGRTPKEIWKNARSLAKSLGADRPEWHRSGS